MKTISIRGIDAETDRVIKARAQQDNLSVNQWILQALKKAAGTGKEPRFKKYNDLDHLAGTWSKEEAKEFQRNIRIFEKIDKAVWK
jgi:hypothetical protein